MPSQNSVQLSIKLDKESLDAIDALAQEHGLTRTWAIRHLCQALRDGQVTSPFVRGGG